MPQPAALHRPAPRRARRNRLRGRRRLRRRRLRRRRLRRGGLRRRRLRRRRLRRRSVSDRLRSHDLGRRRRRRRRGAATGAAVAAAFAAARGSGCCQSRPSTAAATRAADVAGAAFAGRRAATARGTSDAADLTLAGFEEGALRIRTLTACIRSPSRSAKETSWPGASLRNPSIKISSWCTKMLGFLSSRAMKPKPRNSSYLSTTPVSRGAALDAAPCSSSYPSWVHFSSAALGASADAIGVRVSTRGRGAARCARPAARRRCGRRSFASTSDVARRKFSRCRSASARRGACAALSTAEKAATAVRTQRSLPSPLRQSGRLLHHRRLLSTRRTRPSTRRTTTAAACTRTPTA